MYDTETTATELKQWMETGYASDPTGQMHARVRTPQPLFLHFSTALGAETKQKKSCHTVHCHVRVIRLFWIIMH
jgi:hypothetical protein